MVGLAIESEYERKLMVERFQFMLPNVNVVMVARIRGTVTGNQLKGALERLLFRHPLLRARIRLDDEGVAWFVPMDHPEVSIQETSKVSEGDWVEHAVEQFRFRFSLRDGPLIRFVLLSSSETSDLIINCHHTICDGLSLVYLIRDIMNLIGDRGREITHLPVPPPMDKELIPSSTSGGLFTNLLMRWLNWRWRRKNINFSESDYERLHEGFWEDNDTDVVSWELSRMRTSRLVASCRREGVTVTSALITALLKAQCDVDGLDAEYSDRVTIAANLRNRLSKPVGEAFGYYASAINIKHGYDGGKNFWDNARAVNEKVRGKLTDKNLFASQRVASIHPTLIDSFGFAIQGLLEDDMVERLLGKVMENRRSSVIVSNLGRQDSSVEYGGLRLESIRGPCVHSYSEKYLGVVTVDGKMSMTFSFNYRATPRRVIERIRDKMTETLLEDSN